MPNRRLATVAGIAATLLLSSCSKAEPNRLLGCWQARTAVQTFAGGATQHSKPNCTSEFTSDRIVTLCAGQKGESRIEYAYKIVQPNVYRATIVASSDSPGIVGSTRDYEYFINGPELRIINNPQTTTPKPLTQATRFESLSERVQAPGACRPTPAARPS